MLTGWGHRLIATDDTPEHVDRVLSKPPKMAELRAALAELVRTTRENSVGACRRSLRPVSRTYCDARYLHGR